LAFLQEPELLVALVRELYLRPGSVGVVVLLVVEYCFHNQLQKKKIQK
jgi:hypothetical protein